MSRTLMAAASWRGASARPRRRARRRTWSMDSSPEIYMTLRPARASLAAAWSMRVDLPMPGSPPTRTTEAGTKPPPRTRSSSAMPEWARGRGGGFALEADEGDPAVGGGLRGVRAGFDGFLDEGVPFAAGVAAAGPLGVDGAAGLADVAGSGFSHWEPGADQPRRFHRSCSRSAVRKMVVSGRPWTWSSIQCACSAWLRRSRPVDRRSSPERS